MYELFVQVGGNLADEADSQRNDLFSLQRWERSKQLSGTDTHTLAFGFFRAANLYYIPRIRKKFLPHHHKLGTNTQDVQMRTISEEKVPE